MVLYNSLTKTKETFTPRDPKKVTMYVCGITPYDTTHLGHAFTYIAFDSLYRYLTFQKYKVVYTQNVTDIDDDILKKAKQIKRDWIELGQYWTDKFVKDNKTLNNTPPTHYVKATETMPTIVEIIEKLLTTGFAYEAGGNIYFRSEKAPHYGKLSDYTRDQMIALSRERGANPDDPHKEDPLDFIMWQKSRPDEPSWDSPKVKGKTIAKGRPGWHIECSAMIYKYLDNCIDIHGGGLDLIYPHHESEIAQSEAFTGEKPFSQFFMHTGPVRYEGEKMSKSLGNLVMVSDLLQVYTPNAIRALLISHHYRVSWEYHEDELKHMSKRMKEAEIILKEKPTSQGTEQTEFLTRFTEAFADDLNTPKALEIFFELVEEYEEKPTFATEDAIQRMGDLLGFYL